MNYRKILKIVKLDPLEIERIRRAEDDVRKHKADLKEAETFSRAIFQDLMTKHAGPQGPFHPLDPRPIYRTYEIVDENFVILEVQ